MRMSFTVDFHIEFFKRKLVIYCINGIEPNVKIPNFSVMLKRSSFEILLREVLTLKLDLGCV